MRFCYLAFGGGRHGCMGHNFAFLQIKTIWSYLLRNFDFAPVDPFPTPNYDAMVVGMNPAWFHSNGGLCPNFRHNLLFDLC